MIDVRDIGISLDIASSRLGELEQHLAYYQGLGYRLVELDPTPYALIIDGELCRPQLENLLAVLGNFDLRYSFADGPWITWLTGTKLTSAEFKELDPRDGIYRFEVRARDSAGRQEAFAGRSEAGTIVDRREPHVVPQGHLPMDRFRCVRSKAAIADYSARPGPKEIPFQRQIGQRRRPGGELPVTPLHGHDVVREVLGGGAGHHGIVNDHQPVRAHGFQESRTEESRQDHQIIGYHRTFQEHNGHRRGADQGPQRRPLQGELLFPHPIPVEGG